jgi:ribulose-phosphate 3-epimerase
MLLCDFGNLEHEVRQLTAGGVRGLHLDVMDGHFVRNLTYGFPIVEAFRRLTDLPLDVHLMIEHPGQYVEQFVQAGADVVTIHKEAVENPRPLLEHIRRLGAAAGLAISPQTPVAAVADCLDACDLVLVMSVVPGFGGQAFRPEALDKLRQLRSLVGTEALLEIDGGVGESNIAQCRHAGADLLVIGSAIFNHRHQYAERIQRLQAALDGNSAVRGNSPRSASGGR